MSAYLDESIGFDFKGRRNTVIATYITSNCYNIWSCLFQLINKFLGRYGLSYNHDEISFSRLLKLYKIGNDEGKYNDLKNLIFNVFDNLLEIGTIRALILFDNNLEKIALFSDMTLYNAYLGDKKAIRKILTRVKKPGWRPSKKALIEALVLYPLIKDISTSYIDRGYQ